jgi:hypothetical protein
MLRWTNNPSKEFNKVITDSLGLVIDEYTCIDHPSLPEHIILPMADDLLKCHQDQKNTYMPTDYHFLLIYKAMEEMMFEDEDFVNCSRINEVDKNDHRWVLKNSEELEDEEDNDYIQSLIDSPREACQHFIHEYFWDTDFLVEDEIEAIFLRDECNGNEELFSIGAKMIPHQDELKLVPYNEEEEIT